MKSWGKYLLISADPKLDMLSNLLLCTNNYLLCTCGNFEGFRLKVCFTIKTLYTSAKQPGKPLIRGHFTFWFAVSETT